MLHRPRVTVVGVPPCARTIPAARLLAPSPTLACSMTTTRSAPDVREKYEAQPPTVPAPTITRSARSSGISLASAPIIGPGKLKALPRRGRAMGKGKSESGHVASSHDERAHAGEDDGVHGEDQYRDACRHDGRRLSRVREGLPERPEQRPRVLTKEKLLDRCHPARVDPAEQPEENALDRQYIGKPDADRHRRLAEEIGESHAEQAPRLEDEPGRAQRLEDVDRGRPGDACTIPKRNAKAGQGRDRKECDRKDGGDDGDDADLTGERLQPPGPLRVDRFDGTPAELATDNERAQNQGEDAADNADALQRILHEVDRIERRLQLGDRQSALGVKVLRGKRELNPVERVAEEDEGTQHDAAQHPDRRSLPQFTPFRFETVDHAASPVSVRKTSSRVRSTARNSLTLMPAPTNASLISAARSGSTESRSVPSTAVTAAAPSMRSN